MKEGQIDTVDTVDAGDANKMIDNTLGGRTWIAVKALPRTRPMRLFRFSTDLDLSILDLSIIRNTVLCCVRSPIRLDGDET